MFLRCVSELVIESREVCLGHRFLHLKCNSPLYRRPIQGLVHYLSQIGLRHLISLLVCFSPIAWIKRELIYFSERPYDHMFGVSLIQHQRCLHFYVFILNKNLGFTECSVCGILRTATLGCYQVCCSRYAVNFLSFLFFCVPVV